MNSSAPPDKGSRLIRAVEAIQQAYTSRDKFQVFELWGELEAARLEALSSATQDTQDAKRYRCWRNAMIAAASGDESWLGMLDRIEAACDLAEVIDSAIDTAMAFPDGGSAT